MTDQSDLLKQLCSIYTLGEFTNLNNNQYPALSIRYFKETEQRLSPLAATTSSQSQRGTMDDFSPNPTHRMTTRSGTRAMVEATSFSGSYRGVGLGGKRHLINKNGAFLNGDSDGSDSDYGNGYHGGRSDNHDNGRGNMNDDSDLDDGSEIDDFLSTRARPVQRGNTTSSLARKTANSRASGMTANATEVSSNVRNRSNDSSVDQIVSSSPSTSATFTFNMHRLIQTPNNTEYLTFAPNSPEHWRAWLHQHHSTTKAIWLIFYNKASGIPSLDYSVAVDHALCYGWIDSTRKSFKKIQFIHDPEGDEFRSQGIDEPRYFQLFTPRNVKTSTWSRVNKTKVERLIDEGLMAAAGLNVIDQAKANGQWVSLDDVENMVIPEDLARVFESTPGNRLLRERFEQLSRSQKRLMLGTLNQAKRQETRDKRINDILASLE